ncbi:MAG: hypothetical protein IT196_22655 [Acidimicrobiales bacterium]|nr:hypothetical protein [Acidimicrobiales bacterium]
MSDHDEPEPDEADRLRRALDRAGLLARPERSALRRPDADVVAAARARAGSGTPLSELVTDGR